tara:strand:- start:1205 stop:2038 length:834 start_codon:yes stop_codon:yes gene_type:complete
MAVFGTVDAVAFSNSVDVVNGDATVTKNAADSVVGGDVLSISGVNYIVKTITSATSIELHKNYAGSTATVANSAVIKRTPPKAVAEFVIVGGDSNSYDLVFVDATEASVASNKSRGITGPGWWQYRSYQDHAGSTRHKAECIAALSVAAGAGVGDQADETIAADVLETISITGSTANSTSSSGGGTFAVSAAVDQSGTITYKWQRQTATATTRWVDVVGGANGLDTGITYSNFATATLAYAGLASDALDGYKYRCLVNSSKGAKQVITNTATVTFGT